MDQCANGIIRYMDIVHLYPVVKRGTHDVVGAVDLSRENGGIVFHPHRLYDGKSDFQISILGYEMTDEETADKRPVFFSSMSADGYIPEADSDRFIDYLRREYGDYLRRHGCYQPVEVCWIV